jgi:predicted phage tail component-like protein
MNYIELNGVRSNSITGLLIQSLPPISKPLIRTQVEEIDGRDGDIITKLGYSAYDKEIEIGLRGNFDVDDVIAYFDSEGIVTFSNEPDKYYHYQIIEQIDFERLVRFRTAKVTFHVQPFKYSLSETPVTEDVELMEIPDWTQTKNGVTCAAQNGLVTIQGTSSSATEFYVPIDALNLEAGDYTLYAVANGVKASACSIRLIGSVPSDADSFGGTYLPLQNNAMASMSATLSSAKTYNYVWFYITSGNTMDFSLDVALVNDSVQSLVVTNGGNTISKPKITITGGGTINLSLNGEQIFVINLGNEGQITIDSEQMEAYKDGILKNRLVAGDYDDLVLNVGENTLSWTGDVSSAEIENYSRWI